MKKGLAYALSVGLIAAASVVATTPAQAAVTATLSPTTDLFPGQEITVTLVDDGTFCPAQMIADNVGDEWGGFADIFDADNNVVGGISVYAGESYTGIADTYTLTGNVEWMVDTSTPAEAGEYTTEDLSCDAISGTGAGVDANSFGFSYKPIAVSASTVAAGSTVDVTVFNQGEEWCDDENGPGFSMGIALFPSSGDTIYIPEGLGAGTGVKGLGDFDWEENVGTATVTVTIPSTVPGGTYTLFAGCVTDEASGYQQPGPGMQVQNFVVTAALADTGLSASTMGATGLAGLALLATGAVIVFARRRSAGAR